MLPCSFLEAVKMPLYIQRVKEASRCHGHQEYSFFHHFSHVICSSLLTQTTTPNCLNLTFWTLIKPPALDYSTIDLHFTILLTSAVVRRQAANSMMEIENRAYHEGHMRSALAMVTRQFPCPRLRTDLL